MKDAMDNRSVIEEKFVISAKISYKIESLLETKDFKA